jgi:hypothetical protein
MNYNYLLNHSKGPQGAIYKQNLLIFKAPTDHHHLKRPGRVLEDMK